MKESKQSEETTKYAVPAIVRTMEILQSLKKGPQSLAELSRNLGINKSTCLNILRTLEQYLVVESNRDTGRYRLGVGLVELGAGASEYYSHIEYTKRLLFEYLDKMNCTFVFYQRVGLEHVALVDKIEPPGRVKVTLPLGARVPIQGGSFGRCFLAYDPPEIQKQLLSGGLVEFTTKSVRDVDQFYKEMAETRARGWSEDREGYALGINTVATPIFDANGMVVLVLAAVGISSLMDNDVMKQYGEMISMIAQRANLRAGSY